MLIAITATRQKQFKTMGATRTAPSNAMYLQVKNGRICQVNKEANEFTKEIDGKFYEFFKAIDGHLTFLDIEKVEHNGKAWNNLNIRLTDTESGQNMLLKTFFPSREASQFLNRLLSSKDDQLKGVYELGMFQDTETQRTVVMLSEDGEKLPFYSTKDNPREVPPLVQVKKGKDLIWNDTDQVNFYAEFVDKVKDILRGNAAEKYNAAKEVKAIQVAQGFEAAQASAAAASKIKNDDLPF